MIIILMIKIKIIKKIINMKKKDLTIQEYIQELKKVTLMQK